MKLCRAGTGFRSKTRERRGTEISYEADDILLDESGSFDARWHIDDTSSGGRPHRYFEHRPEGRPGERSGVDTALRGPPTLRYNGQIMAGGLAGSSAECQSATGSATLDGACCLTLCALPVLHMATRIAEEVSPGYN